MKVFDEVDRSFEQHSMALVEAIRLNEDPSEELFCNLKQSIRDIKEKYINEHQIPKYTYYCIQVLRDNLLGEMQRNSKKEDSRITSFASLLDMELEELLLSSA